MYGEGDPTIGEAKSRPMSIPCAGSDCLTIRLLTFILRWTILRFQRSIDLCEDNPQEAYYRHDLESFFYVLVRILTNFDRGKLVLRDEYRYWREGYLKSIAHSKRNFMVSATRTTPDYLDHEAWGHVS